MTIRTTLMVLVGVGALAAASALGFFISYDTYELVALSAVALMAGIVALSVQLRHPFLGLSLLVVTAVALPFEFGADRRTPMNSSFFLASALCLIWLLDLVVLRRSQPPMRSRVRAAAFAFLGSVLTSFAIAQVGDGGAPLAAQIAQVSIFVVSITTFLVAGELIANVVNLKRLLWVFLITGTFVCLVSVVSNFGVLQDVVTMAHVESVGSVFWTWMAGLSASQAMFNRELRPGTRFLAWCMTALILFRGLVLARSWSSGWIPPLIAVFVVFLFRYPRLVALTGGMAAIMILYFQPTTETFTPADEEYSAMTRYAAAEALLPLLQANPLVGTGPANYYYLVESSSILGWYVRFSSHNQFLDIAAQLGSAGLITFGWLVYEIGAAAWSLCAYFRTGFERAYVLGVLAGLTGTVVSGALADWVFPFYYNIGIGGVRSSILFWVFLSGIFVLRKAARNDVANKVQGACAYSF